MNKKTAKVSVIMPVYNSEKYLIQCLDSILGQSLREVEVICVDDGSTDSSYSILKSYAGKDERIRILQQENKYAGVARNYGMTAAAGEYCVFLDSDDFFERTMLEDMYQECKRKDADICICRGRIYDEVRHRIVLADTYLRIDLLPKEMPFSWREMPETIFNFTLCAPWLKMYRMDFIRRTNLEFQALERTNDFYFCHMSLVLAKRITIVNKILVNYRIGHPFSLQATKEKRPFDFYQAMLALKEGLIRENIFQEVERSFVNACLSECIHHLKTSRSGKSYHEIYKKLKTEIFRELGIYGHNPSYYYVSTFYQRMKEIVETSLNETVEETQNRIAENYKEETAFDSMVQPEEGTSTKVSVIIPVCQAEKFIEECVRSVTGQTLKEIEIICVNNGSADDSMKIIERLQKEDVRIRILDSGSDIPALARNCGIKEAKGEFILFLDSSDYLAGCALEHLYCHAKSGQLDMLFYNADIFCEFDGASEEYFAYRDHYKRKNSYLDIVKGKELLGQMNKKNDFKPFFGIQFLDCGFLKENKIGFQENLPYADELFTLQCMYLARSTKSIDEPLYMKRAPKGFVLEVPGDWEDAYGGYTLIREMMKFLESHQEKGDSDSEDAVLETLEGYCYSVAAILGRMDYKEILSNIRALGLEDRARFYLMFVPLYKSEKKRKASEMNIKNLEKKLRASNAKLAKEKKASQKKIAALRSSGPYRIGRIITWLPRKVLRLLRRFGIERR